MKRVGQNTIINDTVSLKFTRKIAEGGMGSVYEAQQLGTEGFEKTVAIKMLLRELADETFAELFVAEAKLVANLVHENIVQIYQLGRIDSEYYIVMEYVHGISLGDFLQRHRFYNMHLPEELAVFLVSRIARGLAYAHKRQDRKGNPLNIVHRDVCPHNILITTEGLPKLADFGVAKAANTALLDDKYVVGKYLYMAPEQGQRKHVDFRADIFALGAILFELLSYQPIRDPDAVTGRASDLVKEIPWDLLPKKIPKTLISILKKMLAINGEDRYQDTNVMARALEYYIYRDGYGPTIQTLEDYLRKYFDYLYVPDGQTPSSDPGVSTLPAAWPKTNRPKTRGEEMEETRAMDPPE